MFEFAAESALHATDLEAKYSVGNVSCGDVFALLLLSYAK